MDNLRQTQFQTSVDVVEHDSRMPPTTIGDALGGAAEMLHILRVRRERRTREPLMITEAWLPADLSRHVTASALRRTPLYELLSGAGVVVDRMQHEITAEIAGPRNAGLLNVRSGRHCFESTGWHSWPARRTTMCRSCCRPTAVVC